MKEKIKRRILRRLKIVEGQIRGLQKMVAREAYCIDIITQSSAIREALSEVGNLILENHLSTCAVQQMQGEKTKKAIDEVMMVYKLAKKK